MGTHDSYTAMTVDVAYATIRAWFTTTGVQYGIVPSGACMYRTPEGHRCGIGALIPDADYAPFMEKRDPDELIDLLWPDTIDPNLSDFLNEVQSIHDTAAKSLVPMEEFIGLLDDEYAWFKER